MAIGLNHNTEITRPGEEIFLQVGSIFSNGKSTAPSGYLLCDGSLISRTVYSRLFNVIGITYGSGDGSTTFALPDLKGAYLRGTGTSTRFTQNQTVTLNQTINDQFQSFLTHLQSWYSTSGDGSANARNQGYGSAGPYGDEIKSTGRFSAHGTNGTPRNGNETRPNSVGINFFIKF